MVEVAREVAQLMPVSVSGAHVTDEMLELRSQPLAQRIDAYQAERIRSQRSWYASKSEFNSKKSYHLVACRRSFLRIGARLRCRRRDLRLESRRRWALLCNRRIRGSLDGSEAVSDPGEVIRSCERRAWGHRCEDHRQLGMARGCLGIVRKRGRGSHQPRARVVASIANRLTGLRRVEVGWCGARRCDLG